MITLLIVVCIISATLAQIKVMQENKSIEKYGWTYCKDARDTARTIRIGSLIAFVSLLLIKGPLDEWNAVNEAKNTAWVKNTDLGPIFVPCGYGPDSNGDCHDMYAMVPMCNKCGHHVGTWSNPGHGHKLVTKSHPTKGMGLEIFPAELEDRYVRSCPLD